MTEDLRQFQGFYVYRNRRLIIWGTWFRLIKQNELGKLARVQVDIPNSLDSIWEIDVKKSTASLPAIIRKNLADIVRNAVGSSERVYRYRGRNVQTDSLIHVWNPIDDRGKFQCRINREIPIYGMLEEHLDEAGASLLDSFLRILEDSFPYADVYYRMAKNNSGNSGVSQEEETVYDIADQMVQEILSMNGNVQHFLRTMHLYDYFAGHPDVVQRIKEVYGNDR